MSSTSKLSNVTVGICFINLCQSISLVVNWSKLCTFVTFYFLPPSLFLSLSLPPPFPSRLALGCELVYQRAGSDLQDASLSLGGYYRAETWEATARLGVHSWAIGYQQQFKDNLMLMADLEGSLMQVHWHSNISFTIGYSTLDIHIILCVFLGTLWCSKTPWSIL